ncbi:MAG: glycoside hydrolase family 5 protein [Oscillospiraceae bacterium]|jgi:aryl-phospho-beta-D-glucosidase BglC (GH1 family)|nr:glycoside hydrolase family 5 protein [Oscillospiraceae bacterium]
MKKFLKLFVILFVLLIALSSCGPGANTETDLSPGGSGETSRPSAQEEAPREPVALADDDWLSADGNRIVDKDGNTVRLTGLNWFGYNTERLILDGSWGISIADTVAEIASRGFNIIRVPMSVTLINKWTKGEFPVYATVDSRVNPVFKEEGTLAYLDYFIKCCKDSGVKVMLDIHSVRDSLGAHGLTVWYDISLTTEKYYAALEFLAGRYKNNDTVVAYDLKNEPHGQPDSGKTIAVWNDSEDESSNWKYVAEQAAKRVLAVNPNALIIIEGIESYPKDIKNNNYISIDNSDYYITWWGGNLRGVKDCPVDLGEFQSKVVYSPHDYGPSVSNQPWFHEGFNYESLTREAWMDNWLYIHEENIAPLFVGEWGGPMKEPTMTWMRCFMRLLEEKQLSHTFWCLNPNSGDTGGLLLDDWKTWDEEKYNFIKASLWRKDGRFIGLDAQIPLGGNGMSRTEFYAD